jgi:hypothetical protein
MRLRRIELLPLGLAMDLSYAATPPAGNCCQRRAVSGDRL